MLRAVAGGGCQIMPELLMQLAGPGRDLDGGASPKISVRARPAGDFHAAFAFPRSESASYAGVG
jgi:hypothetical protein